MKYCFKLLGNDVYSQTRCLGYVLIFSSWVKIAIACVIYSFLKSNQFVTFWVGIFAFFSGYFSVRGYFFFGFISAFVSGFINVIMGITEMYQAGFVKDSGCYSPITYDTWGRSSQVESALSCPYVASVSCICALSTSCHTYDLSLGDDCGTLWTVYVPELFASATFGIFLGILSFFSLHLHFSAGGPEFRPERVVVDIDEVVTYSVGPSTDPAIVPSDPTIVAINDPIVYAQVATAPHRQVIFTPYSIPLADPLEL